MKRLLMAASTVLIMCAQASATTHVVLIAGQSNVCDQGVAVDLPDEYRYLLSCPPGVRLFAWGEEVPYEGRSKFGVEVAIAHAWQRENVEDELWVVKCGKGGTSISSWLPSKTRRTLYHQMRVAFRTIITGAPDVVLDRFIWIQGEKDCWYDRQVSLDYSVSLRSLIRSVRRDMGTPETPVSVVVLSEPILHRPYTQWIMGAQWGVSDVMLGVTSIDSAGIAKRDDLLHYSEPHLLGMWIVGE